MAIDPITMYMIAQGAVKAGQAGSRLLKPKFGQTAYGQQMRERTRSGNLSQAQEKNILDKVGTTAGRNAQVARNRMVGSAINRGMGGSVALGRGIREAEADVRRTVTDTGKNIYQSEEQAKSKAKLDYAKAIDQDKEERTNAGLGVLSAGIETAGNLYGAKAGKIKSQDQSYTDAMKKYGYATAFQTPSGETRYQGGGFDPQTGEARGPLTLDDARTIEVYNQKTGNKNATAVQDYVSKLMSGQMPTEDFEKQMMLLPGWNKERVEQFITDLIGG
tara:strand:+ start:286 stop:1110 length:825 start_codon:yes stop_codon:yes gene_type:complete